MEALNSLLMTYYALMMWIHSYIDTYITETVAIYSYIYICEKQGKCKEHAYITIYMYMQACHSKVCLLAGMAIIVTLFRYMLIFPYVFSMFYLIRS